MNVNFSQKARRGRLATELGKDRLVLVRMDGEEELAGVFEWRVEALATDDGIDLDQLLGTHATVEVQMMQGSRFYDGIVCEASLAGMVENGVRYDLVLRPWLHLASLRRNHRIFHKKNVIEIIEEVLGDYGDLGNPHLKVQTSEDYPELEYTVQYGESDADFVSRQMERFGITWMYEHSAGNHTLVLVDNTTSLPEIEGGSRPYRGVEGHHFSDEEHFNLWKGGTRITTGAVKLTEYNFKIPRTAQQVEHLGDAEHERGDVESFDWPGDYLEPGQGSDVVRKRTEAERGQGARHHAVGDIPALGAGVCVSVSGDEIRDVTGNRFVCLRAAHTYRSQAYGSGESQDDDRAFEGRYTLMPDSSPLRPERKVDRPIVEGPETATVVGSGEIDCDKYGRILVQFPWDLDREYSMRCRVSQNWAHRGYGGMVIPRIGMEVIVEHLQGDPDKPIVTGCVYNGINVPPSELPANKTRSVFKTSSHQAEGFNELTFEDEGGEEFIYMHAQKNLDIHVKNSAKRRVDFDDNVSVGNDSNLDVAANRTETIEGDMGVKVTGSLAEKVNADRGADVDGNFAISTGGDFTIKAGGEIVLDASKITLVGSGAAITLQGVVNASPSIHIGSASPSAAAVPAVPAVLQAAAGEGMPFVSHCPLSDG